MDQPWVCPSLLVSYGTLLEISWFSESFGSKNISEINIYVDTNVDAEAMGKCCPYSEWPRTDCGQQPKILSISLP